MELAKTSLNFGNHFYQLLASGHLRINFQKFSAIELTSSGVEVLKNKQKFMFKELY